MAYGIDLEELLKGCTTSEERCAVIASTYASAIKCLASELTVTETLLDDGRWAYTVSVARVADRASRSLFLERNKDDLDKAFRIAAAAKRYAPQARETPGQYDNRKAKRKREALARRKR